MALFDSLIGEVANKFGLGAKAGPLVMALLRSMTNEQAGGLGGFLEKFQSAGLGDLATSWVSHGDNQTLNTTQLTNAMGEDDIAHVARDANLSAAEAKPPLAYLVPKIIDLLTPNGTVPAGLPSTVLSYLSGGAGAALGAGAAAVGTGAAAMGGAASHVSHAAHAATDGGSSFLFKLLPLLAIAVLAFLGYQYCAGTPTTPTTTANANHSTANANHNAAMPAKTALNSSLVIVNKDGKYIVTGVVPDEKTKGEIEAQLKAAYGEGKYDISGLKVDANAKPAEWLAKLKDVLPALAVSGAVLNLNGPDIKLEGVTGAAGPALLEKLKGFFGNGFNLSMAAPVNEASAAEDAEKKAAAALDALPADFTPKQLEDALNLEIINFPSGGAAIPQDREDLLTKSANYIKKLPATASVEVGGHTDSKGSAATNQAISQKRADAVKAFLVKAGAKAESMTAKGYGPGKPIASNDTEEGRFKNRRIQYVISTK